MTTRGFGSVWAAGTLALVLGACGQTGLEGRRVVEQAGQGGGFTGAIYTSTATGTTVNGNIYDAKTDVYLNGGPQNKNGKGLPDGTYYFQVTNPSGSVLLSTDAAECRQVVVEDGVIAGVAPESVLAGCAHLEGTFNPANGSTPVQLFPFDDTPNNGGEYKAHLIIKAEATVGPDGKTLAFSNSDSKTDNFKVRGETPPPPPPGHGKIKPRKVYDYVGDRENTPWASYDLNGEYNWPEPIVGGWPIRITPVDDNGDPTGPTVDTTTMQEMSPTDGRYITLPAGRYRVEELLPTSTMGGGVWEQTGTNVEENGVTAGQGVVSSVIVNVEKDETIVVRFFNVCRVEGAVQTFPAAAMEDISSHDWACKPSFLTSFRK